MNIVKGTILFIGVSISLFVSCVPPQQQEIVTEPIEVVTEPIEVVTEPIEVVTEPSAPDQKIAKIFTSSLTQDWASYTAERKAEGYTLLSVSKSEELLKDHSIAHNTGINHQYNIRTVMTLTIIITTQRDVRVDTVLIVNDDTGKPRVFKK